MSEHGPGRSDEAAGGGWTRPPLGDSPAPLVPPPPSHRGGAADGTPAGGRRWVPILAVVAVVAVLAGVAVVALGGDDGGNGSASEANPLLGGQLPVEAEGPAAEPERLWSADVSCAPASGEPEGSFGCIAVADAERVYLLRPAEEGEGVTLTAYDGATGDEAWSIDAPDVGRAPVAIGGVVLFSGTDPADSSVTAFDAETGEERWQVQGGLSPYGTEDGVFVYDPGDRTLGTAGVRLLHLDVGSGDVRWEGVGYVVGLCDGVVVTSSGRELVAYDLDGDERWRQPLVREGEEVGDSSRACFGDAVLVQNGDQLRLFATADGEERWTAEVAEAREAAVLADEIALVSTRDEVVALDLDAGVERWRQPADDLGRPSSAVAVGEGRALVSSRGREVGLVDLSSGESVGKPVVAERWPLGVASGRLYGTDEDRIVTYGLDDLAPGWTLTLDDPVRTVAAGGGRVYAVGLEQLTAFA